MVAGLQASVNIFRAAIPIEYLWMDTSKVLLQASNKERKTNKIPILFWSVINSSIQKPIKHLRLSVLRKKLTAKSC